MASILSVGSERNNLADVTFLRGNVLAEADPAGEYRFDFPLSYFCF
jgi:hypothetical protein